MEPGDRIGACVVESVLADDLALARDAAELVLLRVGDGAALDEAVTRYRQLGVEPVGHWRLDDGRGALAVSTVGGEVDLGAALARRGLRPVFRELAEQLVALHAVGGHLGQLDPAGVRVGSAIRVLPPFGAAASWGAPEPDPSAAADWYVFGHLLYWALTGGASFEAHGSGNAPDPRDRRADAPDALAVLAMDLLLLEPSHRATADEVLATLGASDAEAGEALDLEWLAAALERGGVVVAPADAAESVAVALPARSVRLGDDVTGLLEWVRTAQALTVRQRATVTAAVHAPDTLTPEQADRAGRWLGVALATRGQRAVCVDGADARWEPLLTGLLRATQAPLLVICGAPSAAFAARCAAEAVSGVPTTPVEALPWQRATDGALALLDQGSTGPLVAELRLLGAPVGSGMVGRARARLERALTPSGLGASGGDIGLDRAALELASALWWVEPARATTAAAWLERRAWLRGDADGVAGARLVTSFAGTDRDVPPGVGDRGQAWARVGRALRHRLTGQVEAVEQTLGLHLPLPEAGPAANTLAALLLAEARIEAGAWGLARRGLRALRVDARATGDRIAEAAARCLLVRLGEPVELPEPWGQGLLRAWWAVARAAQASRRGDALEAAEAAAEVKSVFTTWPLAHAGALAVEGRGLMRWVTAGPPEPGPAHPLTPAWELLATASACGDRDGRLAALEEAERRFEGAGRRLRAAACRRRRGLRLGGMAGGRLVESADRELMAQGVRGIPRQVRWLCPLRVEGGQPVDDDAP